ncbi:MAG TPA: FAD-dependent thymidylate synthase [Aggregatilineales bacterium]|nr:FAD-dependent thymidylate synthase [Chloroflexota bacterium]HOA22682.1 FAD-dependent thymidylate synthase [Aggregatilineales bacterium]HPV06625.1 FAD-dependent thymidylate synthase [Aggregatilineales bacterium]HQA67516.1 FAD-dependent thymidylate synthase [Aggregatilineales bacterium]
MHADTPEPDPRQPNPDALAIRRRVLGDDKSWVELQDMLPHPKFDVAPDLSIVNAARVSFLGHSKGDEQDKKLLFYLMRHGHTSPFEQVEFKFRVRAPVVVWWQWVRHRTWHYNFQSGRYTPFDDEDFYIPPPDRWRKQSPSNKQGSEGTVSEEHGAQYTQALTDLTEQSFALYSDALARGIAKEQARLFLPGWSAYYIAVCKVDAWNLMHFLRLRMAPDAQWEIRQYANAIHEIFREVLPWTAEAFDLYVKPKS